MSDPRAIRRSDRGWRPALRFRGAALLNEHWHKPPASSYPQRCPACDGELTVADQPVHCGGEIFHPECLLYRGAGA